MELNRVLQEYSARNEIIGKKIRFNEAKILFKGDLHAKRLQKEIGAAVQQLNRIYETARKELCDSMEYRRIEFSCLQKACTDRAVRLEMLRQKSRNQYGFSESELVAELSAIEAEIAKADECVGSLTEFDLTVSSELTNLCRSVLTAEEPLYIRTSVLFPAQVELIMSPSTCAADDPTTTTVTVLAIPAYPDFRLHHLLTGTLESLAGGTYATNGATKSDDVDNGGGDDDDKESKIIIRGVTTSLNDKRGSVKITFSPVPPVGEYVVKVTLYHMQVKNSPLIVRLTSTSTLPQVTSLKNEAISRGLTMPVPIRRTTMLRSNSITLPDSNGFANAANRPSSPPVFNVVAAPNLRALANRARTFSESSRKAAENAQGGGIIFPLAAVAPKRPMPMLFNKKGGGAGENRAQNPGIGTPV